MITENEVEEIITNEFPEVKNELMFKSTKKVYKTIEYFVEFTKELARSGDISSVRICFGIAEKMLNEGNNVVKNAIENVYVYSIGTFVCSIQSMIPLSPTPSIQLNLKELFNGSLRKEYYKQVLTSGV